MNNISQLIQPSLELPFPCDGQEIQPTQSLTLIPEKELIQLKWDSHYWKTQHARAIEREAQLKKVLEHQLALIRDLRQRLFGKQSEKEGKRKELNANQDRTRPKKNPRGQKKGSCGHGRTKRLDLPGVREERDLDLNSNFCQKCGLPLAPFPGDEESEIFEVEVRAYKRKVYRKRYKKNCRCAHTSSNPGIIVAPPAPKVIPKSVYGISVWERILLGKFLYAQPLNRILKDFKSQGLPISQGTVTGGLKKISNLLEPIEQGLYEKQMREDLFHNDESRWEVFEEIEGKVGHRWYLWVTRSSSVIYYHMDPTRSAEVPKAHFSELKPEKAIVVCDRYSAYQKFARLNHMITLAYCWVHVRRDFLDLARNNPKLENWGLEWVKEIGKLYHLNQRRLACWQPEISIEEQSPLFKKRHIVLQEHLRQIKSRCDHLVELDQQVRSESQNNNPNKLKAVQRKVLTSLQKYWHGLIIFINRPEVPMDNNAAERAIRNPVCGRKNYYGSGSIWSANLSARMFSILQTMEQWKLNPLHWLREYLTACANNGGQPPKEICSFLPWRMSDERWKHLSKPPPSKNIL